MSLLTLRAPASLDLPPAFRPVALPEPGDAHAHACEIAAQEGAGTFVWVRRDDAAEFAVVLEPEAALREARRAFFMGMNALLQAIAANAPADRPLTFDWPDAIRFNAGLVGGSRLAWPPDCQEDEVPDWLVFSGMVRVVLPGHVEPGNAPDAAALEDEGFEGAGPSAIIESFARFFMRQVDLWQNAGQGPTLADYLARLVKERAEGALALTENADLRIHPAGGGQDILRSFLPALRATSWLDRETGAPRL